MTSRTADPPARRREAGYNMVVLMVGVTILAVATAAALPMWSQAMKREKEAELISRGWQYAEAIRVFQQRHGRYPTRLEELMEVKPRSIRRLWKDPMTESGKWGLVLQGGVTPPGTQGRELGGGRGLSDGREDQDGSGGLRTPRAGEQRTVGSIIGVRSLSEEESIKILFDEQSYDQWQFTVEKIGAARGGEMGLQGVQGTTPRQVQGAIGPGGRPFMPKTEWIGKPFPEGVQPAGGSVGGGPGPVDGSGPDPQGRPRGAPRPDRDSS